jgi:hypothetical protein
MHITYDEFFERKHMTLNIGNAPLFSALIIFVVGILGSNNAQAIEPADKTNMSTEVAYKDLILEASLTELVLELNKQTPIKVDADTRLDSVSTFSKYMIYNNTLTEIESTDVDASLVAQHFNENIISQLCFTETFRPFIDLKLVMVYRYLDKNGKLITELSKDLSGC